MRTLVVSIAAAVCVAAPPVAQADRPAKLFGYSAVSAGLGGGMSVRVDGTWEYRSHDQAQNQRGKLSRRDLKRFRRLLRAARFDATVADADQACETDRQVIYHDGEQQRTVTVRPPCSDVDEATGRLPSCLWSLISGTSNDCDP